MSDRAVFDCMVFLQAVLSERGPAFACFRLVEEGRVTLCVSPAVLAEVKEVLTRPTLSRRFPHLTPERVEAFLETVRARAVLLNEVPKATAPLHDPDDEPYLSLAVAAGAKYLVSRDKDLLDLMNDPAFRKQFPDSTILDPVALLTNLSGAECGGKPPESSPPSSPA